MRVRDAQADRERLYAELVGATHRHEQKKGVKDLISDALDVPDLQYKLYRGLDIPVDGRKLTIPYAFQNGRFNLIQPVRFQSENPLSTIYKYAVEGDSIFETPHDQFGEMRLLVVGKFREGDNEGKQKAKRILGHHHVGLFPTEDLGKLANEIRETGKSIG